MKLSLVFAVVLACLLLVVHDLHAPVLVAVKAQDNEEDYEDIDDDTVIPTGKQGDAGLQDEYDEFEIVEEVIASPHMTVAFTMPDFDDMQIPVGEDVAILVGLTNTGELPFNVTTVTAQLVSPFDRTFVIQNFTRSDVNAQVDPGTQLTLEYAINVNPRFETLEFVLTGFVEYHEVDDQADAKAQKAAADAEARGDEDIDEEDFEDAMMLIFRSTFLNETVTLTEQNTDFSVRHVFSYFMYVSVLGLIGYVAFNAFVAPKLAKKQKKKRAAAAKERGTKGADVGDEWLQQKYSPRASPQKKTRTGVKK